MKPSDFAAFNAMLSDCLAMWSGPPSAGITATWFRTLEGYSLPVLSAAFSAHMRDPVNGKFEPKPAHLIEQIERAARNDGRPGAEEAWAVSLAARDERGTVVWTHECAQAWAAAAPIMALRDEVGARMAFKETYARLVAEARARREPVDWQVSEGFCKDLRRAAIAQAVEAGRIPVGSCEALEGGSALLLGVAAGGSGVPDGVRQKMAELRERLTRVDDGPSKADDERERLGALKRAAAERVAAYTGAERSGGQHA
jgi:hypothetical protein